MQVTITNSSSPAKKVYVSMLWKSLAPGESETVTRTSAQLEAEEQLRELQVAGDVTLTFATDANDAAQSGVNVLSVYTNATRPAATTMPAGGMIWNSDDAAPNTSDGTDWKDSAGSTT